MTLELESSLCQAPRSSIVFESLCFLIYGVLYVVRLFSSMTLSL